MWIFDKGNLIDETTTALQREYTTYIHGERTPLHFTFLPVCGLGDKERCSGNKQVRDIPA